MPEALASFRVSPWFSRAPTKFPIAFVMPYLASTAATSAQTTMYERPGRKVPSGKENWIPSVNV